MNSTNACAMCKREDATIPFYSSGVVCKRCSGILEELTSFDPKKSKQINVHNDAFPKGGE